MILCAKSVRFQIDYIQLYSLDYNENRFCSNFNIMYKIICIIKLVYIIKIIYKKNMPRVFKKCLRK